MRRILIVMIMVFSLPLVLMSSQDNLSKSKGTDQNVIVQLVPFPAQEDVSRTAKIEATFAVPLDISAIQEHNIKLTCLSSKTHEHMAGTITSQTEKKLIFTPKASLKPGLYEVEIKSLKAEKAYKDTNINEIKYRFVVIKELLQSITIRPDTVELKESESLPLEAIGHYDTGVEKNITAQVQWSTTDSQIVTVDANATLRAIKEGATTITAKLGNVESSTEVIVYWEVNGHRLPPEPDKALNDSTLLGIDSNNNGVRDDVERKIYEKYPKKLHRALLMDGAGVYQQIMIRPTEEARETQKSISRIIHCKVYLRRIDIEIKSYDFNFMDFLEDYTFNTKERARKYLDYNLALSGGNYASKPSDWNRNECSEETIHVLEEMGL
ncbi:MAG: Ig-like domain-containing protein [Sulfurovum sp.]|nr:Ig-like domain-containing protein [Sulfurovum sp.]MDD3602021.1 Ig-like domain-containing protein [Sulfurovum sp.]